MALNTNIAAAAGVLGAVVTSWLVIKKPDLSMMLNGAIAALVAITAACAFVAPWAAILIGFVAGVIVVLGVLLVEKLKIDDPIGALAAHGMAGVWGTLSLGFLTVPALAEKLATGSGGLLYGGGLHQLGVQALGLAAVGAFTFTASFLVLWLFKATFGIRTEPEVESAGLDVSEHGMWGYPEFYIPVPGGYGTEREVMARMPPSEAPRRPSTRWPRRSPSARAQASRGSATGPLDPRLLNGMSVEGRRPPHERAGRARRRRSGKPTAATAAITRAGQALRPSTRRRRAGPRP